MTPRVLIWYWGRQGGGAVFTKLLAAHLRMVMPGISMAASLSSGNGLVDATRPFLDRLHMVDPVGEGAGLLQVVTAIPGWRSEFSRFWREKSPKLSLRP